jgi:hypothetical protein
LSDQLPYMTVGTHRGYEVWTRGKKATRKCLGTVSDVPPHERAQRGRWEAKRNGEVVGSGDLLLEATALLWRTRDTDRIP